MGGFFDMTKATGDKHTAKAMNPDEREHLLRFEYGHGSNYEMETGVDKILDQLIPEDELKIEDHRMFEVLHINTELSWYLMHFEIRRVIQSLRTGDYVTATALMDRAVAVAQQPYDALNLMMSHMTQYSLLRLREQLSEGSTGFDSPGMRSLKVIAKALWKAIEDAMEGHGHTPVSFAIMRMELEGHGVLEDKLALLAQVYDGIQRLDVKITEWKQLHLRMVWGFIGGAFAHLQEQESAAAAGCPMHQGGAMNAEGKEESGYSVPTSLRGRPITDLQRVTVTPLFPALWKVPDAVYQAMRGQNGKDLY